MTRTKEELRQIAAEAQRLAATKPGLGMVALFFDVHGPEGRPTTIILHGVEPGTAVRVLRLHADMMDKEKDQTGGQNAKGPGGREP